MNLERETVEMTRRYYVPPSATVTHYLAGTTVSLPDDEASHAARVMRVRRGDEIVIFDGWGNEADAEVIEIDKRSGMIQINQVRAVSLMPARELVLLSCLPKPDRAKEMVERLTEIGVSRLVPLVARRTQREPTDALLEKLRRVVVEACKQSGRNTLMEIASPVRVTDAISNDEVIPQDTSQRLMAHPTLDAPSPTSISSSIDLDAKIALLVGPEGGFTDEEVENAVQVGFSPWDLGSRIYRVETAAVVGATLLLS